MPKPKSKKTRKKKSHSGNMDIALSYRVEALPPRTLRSVFYATLLRWIDEGVELPDTWRVILRWRNSKKSKWREDEFMSAVNNSREGFNKLVRRRLKRDMNK